MKKFFLFIVLALICVGFSVAQNANNEAQRVVGTWGSAEIELVFNANGTGTFKITPAFAADIGIPVAALNANIDWGVSVSGQLSIVLNFTQTTNLNRDINELRMKFQSAFRNEPIFYSLDSRKMIYAGIVLQKR